MQDNGRCSTWHARGISAAKSALGIASLPTKATWIFTHADHIANISTIAFGVAVLATQIRLLDLIVGAGTGILDPAMSAGSMKARLRASRPSIYVSPHPSNQVLHVSYVPLSSPPDHHAVGIELICDCPKRIRTFCRNGLHHRRKTFRELISIRRYRLSQRRTALTSPPERRRAIWVAKLHTARLRGRQRLLRLP